MTSFNGLPFRSPLEARWAVFFYSLGLEWDYKDETGDYRPDFFLPAHGYWVEISPEYPNARTLERLEQFAADREGQRSQETSAYESVFLFWGEMNPAIRSRVVSPRHGRETVATNQDAVTRARQIALQQFKDQENFDNILAAADPVFAALLQQEAVEEAEDGSSAHEDDVEPELLLKASEGDVRGELLCVDVSPTFGFEGDPSGDMEHNVAKISKEPFAWVECPLCERVELCRLSDANWDANLQSFAVRHSRHKAQKCPFPRMVFETGRVLDAFDKSRSFVT